MILTKDKLLVERDALEHSMYLATYRNRIKNLFDTIAALQSERDALLEALGEIGNLIEGYVDVVDGLDGQPQANNAMKARQRIEEALLSIPTSGEPARKP